MTQREWIRTGSGIGRSLTAPVIALLTLCLLVTSLAFAPPSLAQEDGGQGQVASTLMLFDLSGSMTLPIEDGRSRLAAAQDAMISAIGGLTPGSRNIGIRTFSRCATSLVNPIAPVAPDALAASIASFRAAGGTDISGALAAGAIDLAGRDGRLSIILLSDGEQTCNDRDPCATAKVIVASGIDVLIHTIGIGTAGTPAQDQLACIAEATGGTVVSVDKADELFEAIDKAITGAASTATLVPSAFTCINDPAVQADDSLDGLTVGSVFVDDQGVTRTLTTGKACDFYCDGGYDANCDGVFGDYCPVEYDANTVAGAGKCLDRLEPNVDKLPRDEDGNPELAAILRAGCFNTPVPKDMVEPCGHFDVHQDHAKRAASARSVGDDFLIKWNADLADAALADAVAALDATIDGYVSSGLDYKQALNKAVTGYVAPLVFEQPRPVLADLTNDYLVPYTPAYIWMESETAAEAEELRVELRLGRNQYLAIDPQGTLFVAVDTPTQTQSVTVAQWAILLYSVEDPGNEIFDADYDESTNFEAIADGWWRVTWPDGSIAFVTTAQRAVIEYTEAQGFVITRQPPHAVANYFGRWQAFQPRSLVGTVHVLLDIVGFVPVVGEVADGINALIYVLERDWINAAVSSAAIVPVVGSTATGARVAARTGGRVVESYRAVDGTTIDVIERNGVEFAAVKGPDGSISLVGKADELGDGLAGARIVADGDPEALIKVASGHKSVKDPSFVRFGQLAPSTTYVRNGYEYTTDAAGRVVEAGGKLRYAPDSPRYSSYETQVGNYANDAADQGGHIIARIFGGTSEGVNLTPQLGTLNNGAYKAMETRWANALRSGAEIDVRVVIGYADDSLRPTRYSIESTIRLPGEAEQLVQDVFRNGP